jgi:hypothetical protein
VEAAACTTRFYTLRLTRLASTLNKFKRSIPARSGPQTPRALMHAYGIVRKSVSRTPRKKHANSSIQARNGPQTPRASMHAHITVRQSASLIPRKWSNRTLLRAINAFRA